jgi:hypothetical protein
MSHWRETLERPLRRIWKAIMGTRMGGRVINRSSRALWVLETDSGTPIAHRLDPGRASPQAVDADAFRAVDGAPIDGQRSWIKIYDFVTATIYDASDDGLRATGWLRRPVEEREFGVIEYEDGPWAAD